MDPCYFLHDLTLAEARDYIKGQDRRHRQAWEQARMICSYMVACMGGEPDIRLPWDDESEAERKKDPEEEARKFEQLKVQAERMTKYYQSLKKNEQTNSL